MHYIIDKPFKKRGAKMRSLISGFAALAFAASLAFAVNGANAATGSTLVVDELNNQGWAFNPDPNNATPYEFNDDQASLGSGSLFVEPISSTPAHKFIAAKTLGVAVDDLASVSYDFLVAGGGAEADSVHFYLNVYTNLPGSSTYYDCRFDYTPDGGSTSNFTTNTVTGTTTPSQKGDRAGDGFTCPATLGGMPAGSTVKFIALNVGDTDDEDAGLAGYLDNVVVALSDSTTTYDFEHATVLADKNACKQGGWMTSEAPTFKNQGDCVSYFATGGRNPGIEN